MKDEYEFQTGSDCEVILALYRKYGVGCVEKLSGIFGFALYDEANDCYLIARDPIGVIPSISATTTKGISLCHPN